MCSGKKTWAIFTGVWTACSVQGWLVIRYNDKQTVRLISTTMSNIVAKMQQLIHKNRCWTIHDDLADEVWIGTHTNEFWLFNWNVAAKICAEDDVCFYRLLQMMSPSFPRLSGVITAGLMITTPPQSNNPPSEKVKPYHIKKETGEEHMLIIIFASWRL